MRKGRRISVIIPVLNEAKSIGMVLSAIPAWVDERIVVDNGSTDETADIARTSGARVLREDMKGYGAACLKGINGLCKCDIVVFLDGDYSDHPEEMALLVDPIARGEMDFVVGSRIRGKNESGALTPQAIFGNWLSCILMRLIWRVRYSDLGPFRAISYSALKKLGMRDRNYGWTVEMQIKAAIQKLRVCEVPVSYRKRIGKSKISGTIKGVIGAGTKIISTILLSAFHYERGLNQRLIVFTRYPKPGETKTRMIPELGPNGAARLQRCLTEHTLKWVSKLKARKGVSVQIQYDGAKLSLFTEWLGGDWSYRPQVDGDLGRRMSKAFQSAFDEGFERVIIVGIDCPGITAQLVLKAFEALNENDIVLGPANDGGYYMIGMSRMQPSVFDGPDWGTSGVFAETLRIAGNNGMSVHILEYLDDIDRPEDIRVLREIVKGRKDSPKLSIIIPVLNEADFISGQLERLRNVPNAEIIIADGGSSDSSLEVARRFGAKVLSIPECRSEAMNKAAAAAKGDILLFLHADTVLPVNFHDIIRNTVVKNGFSGGAFGFKINGTRRAFRIIDGLVRLRLTLFGLPYGDQGIFTTRRAFRRIGGFRKMEIMEDYEFVKRLKRHGKLYIAKASVRVSPRRWESLGVCRTTIVNQLTILAYCLGVSTKIIARWYRKQ